MRQERKIKLVLRDKDVDKYINMQITEINLYNQEEWKHLDKEM